MKDVWFRFLRGWYRFWIKLAYALDLRVWANNRQRELKEKEAPRSALLRANTPEEVVLFAHRNAYKWRPDATRVGGWMVPLDWISEAEVFQWKLEQDAFPEGDGDCDDRHYWSGRCFEEVPGVEHVMLVSVGYPGGGHTTCAFYRDGKWTHDNYGILPVENPLDIPQLVARWGTDAPKEPRVLWSVFETLDFELLAVTPEGDVDLLELLRARE